MRVSIQTDEPIPTLAEDMVGNVYQVRGGVGARQGHMHIIISAYERDGYYSSGPGFATVTIDREGQIIGGNSYAQHYFMDKMPIAKCDGIESVQLIVRSI